LPGDHTHALLREMGFDETAVTALVDGGVVAQSSSH
jgi:alpha-methylacyl-CoA racemase